MVRTPCYDKSGRKKGTWTKEEDEKLKAYVTKYGCWNWRLIPKFAGLSRCGKSCRLRWLNYLRSDIKRGNFRNDEDDTILELHKTLGNRWSAIAAHLPGRTDNEIKNHWHTNLKKLSNQKPSNSQVEAATARSSALCLQQSTPEEGSSSAKTLCVLNSKATSPSLVSEAAESSSLTTDVAAEKTASFGEAHRDVGFTEHSMELGGNLWTDPFISEEDSFSNPTDVSMGLHEDYDKFLPLYDEFFWP